MDESNSTKHERDPTPDSDFASIVKTESDQSKRTAKRKADDPDRKKSYRRSWRSASPLTKLMIYFTGLIAVATALYMIFSGWQLYEIRSGGDETRKLAQAARDSADIARQDQRPYVWLTNDLGRPGCIRPPAAPSSPECYVVWDFRFTNYGRAPANNVRFVGNLNVGDGAGGKPKIFEPLKVAAPLPPGKNDFATALWQTKITEQEFERLMKSEDTIVLFGRILYTDTYGQDYETGFCLQHLVSGAIAYCGGNEGNYIR